MIKYLVGVVSGVLLVMILPLLKSWYDTGHFFAQPGANLSDPSQYYRARGDDGISDYKLVGDFLDPEIADVHHLTPLTFFRQVPALRLTKETHKSTCVQSFDDRHFTVAFELYPEARQKMLDVLRYQDRTNFQFASGPQQRYVLEANGDRLTWFWQNDKGTQQYADQLTEGEKRYDFVLQVPFHQLETFQRYLQSSIADFPLEGCTPDVDVHSVPHWDDIVADTWPANLVNVPKLPNKD